MTAKQSSREEMTGCLDDSEIDPEMICALLSSLVSPCLLLSPWFFRGARVTRCRASSKLQGRHLNLRCGKIEIENFIVYASAHCIVAIFAWCIFWRVLALSAGATQVTRRRDPKTEDCFWDQTLCTQLLKVVNNQRNKDEDTKTG